MTRPLTVTPTRFAAARHGALDPLEQLHWSLASHALSACVRRGTGAADVLADGSVWLAATQALWPEARAIEDPQALKSVLAAKVGRAETLALRDALVAEVDWAAGAVGPGTPRHFEVSLSRLLDDGTRVFGQLPFVLDDEGVWTLVSLDDGGRSTDLARCWAWLSAGLPHSPGVTFIRLLDPARRRVRELWWDDDAADRLAAELQDSAPVLAA